MANPKSRGRLSAGVCHMSLYIFPVSLLFITNVDLNGVFVDAVDGWHATWRLREAAADQLSQKPRVPLSPTRRKGSFHTSALEAQYRREEGRSCRSAGSIIRQCVCLCG
jgi:hypothetical protein